MKIVIIGGVAGGAGAAAAARRQNEDAQIDVFEAGPYISFANCGLPYYLGGEIEKREQLLVSSSEMMHDRFKISIHVNHEATAIDRAAKTVTVVDHATGQSRAVPYDRLIIATGAKGIRPPTPGMDHSRISECRTIDDVDRIATMAHQYREGKAIVVGGGFIGLEVAEALTHRGIKVTLVDLAPQVLPPFDADIASAARAELERKGMTLKLGVKVDRFEHGETKSAAVLSSGERVNFNFAVLSIGVIPDVALAKAAGLEIGATGGVVVNEYQQTSDPDIYAAGDVTELFYWPTQSRMKLALAGPANKQARVAGANAASAQPTMKTSGAAGTSIVRLFDLAFGMTGLSEKIAEKMKLPYRVVFTQNGHHAGYFPGAEPLMIKLIFSAADGRVLGAQIFGRQGVDKRIDVVATAIQARMTVDDLAELDLAYAPPFGAAKDPIIIAGMVASNVFHGRTQVITPRELRSELTSDKPPFVLDVRSPKEHAAGKIDSAMNIPVDTLRDHLGDIPKNRPIVVHCAVGYRGYVAERILKQHGFDGIRNLTGGFRAWSLK